MTTNDAVLYRITMGCGAAGHADCVAAVLGCLHRLLNTDGAGGPFGAAHGVVALIACIRSVPRALQLRTYMSRGLVCGIAHTRVSASLSFD